MPETLSEREPGREDRRPGVGRVYLVVEVEAVVVLVGVLLWLTHNYRPRSFLGKGLFNQRLWILVLLVSALGIAGSLVPYYVGQGGTNAVFEHCPRPDGLADLGMTDLAGY